MGGGLMQLVAYGAQDIYLTGNPQITFFKVVYRRHTNFSMETIEQTLNGTPGNGQTTSCTISRNGDLVHRMYVTSSANDIQNGSVGLVEEAELEIGGQKIDKHYSEWMNVWNELSTPESKAVALKSMQGDIGLSDGTTGVNFVQVPLQFWFCRNPGLALPLIALQYHEVKVKVTWGANGDNSCGINCDYIYLDTDERRRFAQVSHEYLIEQLQKEDKNTASTTHKLNFNHPVKELIWTTAAAGNYTKANIKLNGHDRFALQDTEYFQLRQPYECHTAVPRQNLPTSAQVFKTNLADHTFTVPTLGPTHTQADVVCSASIYSAADRLPTAEETGTGDTDAGEVGLIHYSAATGVLTLTAGALTDDLANSGFSVGGQIAIIPTVAGAAFVADDLVLASGNASTEGQVFFATIVSAIAVDNVLTLTITKPTLSGGEETVSTIQDAAGGGGENVAAATATQFAVFIVNSNTNAAARTSQMTRNINVYSFALKPEEHQPSGTCNFSRIDNAQLIFETQLECTVYAVNYNVLRIMSGMGGLAYSN